ncbi:unnamed protein product [Auanema sp. JU1783]|nr:unnamed protein product [Auanema sp. JU1783]
MRPDGMLTSRLDENAVQSPRNMYRYLLCDSRQRLIFLWPSMFLILLCSISTVDALAFYVGTSNGQNIREQPKSTQQDGEGYDSSSDQPLSQTERQTIITVCRAAHVSEKFRARLKDPIEFLKICDHLLRQFQQEKAAAAEAAAAAASAAAAAASSSSSSSTS